MRAVAFSDAHNYGHVATGADAVQRWQAWARSVLRSHAFRSERERSIWSAYARGQTYAQMQRRFVVSRRALSRIVAYVEAHAQAKPCRNPWRHGGLPPVSEKSPQVRANQYQRWKWQRDVRAGRVRPEQPEQGDEFWIS